METGGAEFRVSRTRYTSLRRSIFYLNVPIGLSALAVTYLRLRERRDPNLGDRPQVRRVLLESLREPILLVDLSHLLGALGHRDDRGNPTDVTRR